MPPSRVARGTRRSVMPGEPTVRTSTAPPVSSGPRAMRLSPRPAPRTQPGLVPGTVVRGAAT